MSDWIDNALDCGIPQFEKTAHTMLNWLTGILNSFSSNILTVLLRVVTTKLKFLNAMLTVTENSIVFVIVFYIFFLINRKNKRLLDLQSLVHIFYSFFGFTPNIDKEPK